MRGTLKRLLSRKGTSSKKAEAQEAGSSSSRNLSAQEAGSSSSVKLSGVVVHALPRSVSGVELGGDVTAEQMAAVLQAENTRLEEEVKKLRAMARKSSARRSMASGRDDDFDGMEYANGELQDLYDRAVAAVGRTRARSLERARELHSGATLPEALRQFTPLSEEAAIKTAASALPALELAVVHAPKDEAKIKALEKAVVKLTEVTRKLVAERTEPRAPDLVLGLKWERLRGAAFDEAYESANSKGLVLRDAKLESALKRGQTIFSRQELAAFEFDGERLTAKNYVEAWEDALFRPCEVDASALELITECQAAIASGNRDFLTIYGGVWNVIESGETMGLESCRKAIKLLAESVASSGGTARQRKEAESPATLLADAALARPRFEVLVNLISEHTGARLELPPLSERQTGLKKIARVVEKVAMRPGVGRGKSDAVCDVVRAMLVAKDMPTVAAIADAFSAFVHANVARVVRIKDRFETPSDGGWRDLMINLVVEGDQRLHVCEVQVAHEMMLTARKGLPGHEIYAIVRNAAELIESCGRERELRIEAVRALQEAGASAAEVVRCGADAWITDDAEWVAMAGDAAALATSLSANEEGRVVEINMGRLAIDLTLHVPTSIGRLSALIELKLEQCADITSLPEEIGDCTALAILDLQRCGALESLPEGLGRCTNLKELDLSECESLRSLPASLARCQLLETLDLADCTALKELPNLSSLPELDAINLPRKLKKWKRHGYKAMLVGKKKRHHNKRPSRRRPETEVQDENALPSWRLSGKEQQDDDALLGMEEEAEEERGVPTAVMSSSTLALEKKKKKLMAPAAPPQEQQQQQQQGGLPLPPPPPLNQSGGGGGGGGRGGKRRPSIGEASSDGSSSSKGGSKGGSHSEHSEESSGSEEGGSSDGEEEESGSGSGSGSGGSYSSDGSSSEEEEEYEVERIVQERTRGDKLEYKVKWVGLTKPTWEPAKELADTPALSEWQEKKAVPA